MTPDVELLREYAEQGSETAFAEIVCRYMNLVYATSLRLANGDAALAEDVTQTVFTDLARKAEELRSHSTLAGWLHTSAYYATAKAIRGEQRRRRREQEASTMNETTTVETDDCWMQMRPVLDEAVNRLGEMERNALLLRFFQEKSYREIGASLGLSEDATRMRIERGLEKLRDQFARRGVVATAALLTSTLGARAASTVAPATLAAQVVRKSLLDAGTVKAGGVAAKYFGSKTGVALTGAVAASLVCVAALTYSPQTAVKQAAPISVVKTVPAKPALQNISPQPTPTMNTTQIIGAGALAATLITASPAAAATTSQMVSTSQDIATTVVEQTAPNTDSSSSSSADNSDSSTSAPQSADAPVVSAAAINNGPVGIAQWGGVPVGSAKPGVAVSSCTPVLINTNGVLKGKTITAIAGEGSFKLVLCSDGTLVSWGDNSAGELGNPSVKSSHDPVLVERRALGNKKVVAIASGGAHALALCSDGSIYRWGFMFADGNRAPNPNDKVQLTPVLFQPDALRGRKVIALACGFSHCLALCSDGALISWGSYFDTGLFGMMYAGPNHIQPDYWKYVEAHVVNDQGLLKGKKIVAIAAGTSHSLVLCSDGTLAQFGDGEYGDATGDIKDRRAHPEHYLSVQPVPVDTNGVLVGKTITAISVSEKANLALCSDGTLAAWGQERNGEFGNGTASKISVAPVLVDISGVLSGKTVTAIVKTAEFNGGFLALCSDGTLAAWGNGDAGQLGNGKSGVKYFSPRPVLVDETGVLNGKQILAITEGAVLFK